MRGRSQNSNCKEMRGTEGVSNKHISYYDFPNLNNKNLAQDTYHLYQCLINKSCSCLIRIIILLLEVFKVYF